MGTGKALPPPPAVHDPGVDAAGCRLTTPPPYRCAGLSAPLVSGVVPVRPLSCGKAAACARSWQPPPSPLFQAPVPSHAALRLQLDGTVQHGEPLVIKYHAATQLARPLPNHA